MCLKVRPLFFFAFAGVVAVLIGIADLRDRHEAKREELEYFKAEQAENGNQKSEN